MARVGEYQLGETLGCGTFGLVKAAQHAKRGESYAVKILCKSDIHDNEQTERIRREISVMKSLDHPNIVKLHEVMSSKSKLYMVMEVVRGGPISDILHKSGIDEATASRYFYQLVEAVSYCHRKGIVHRNLKPENLLVDRMGILKVTDFGVSSVTSNGSEIMRTTCGTLYYCAPEVLSSDGYRGEDIDAWSCGVILYLMLTGSLPFRHSDMSQLSTMIKNCRVHYPASLSPAARDLLSRILVRDPRQRYSLAEVKKHPWYPVHLGAGFFSTRGSTPMSPLTPSRVSSKMSSDSDEVIEKSTERPRRTPRSSPRPREIRSSRVPQPCGRLEGFDLGPSTYESKIPSHTSSTNLTGRTHTSSTSLTSRTHTSSTNLTGRRVSVEKTKWLSPEIKRKSAPIPSLELSPTTSSCTSSEPDSFSSGGFLESTTVADILQRYSSRRMADFVGDALPGKPLEKISGVIRKLSNMDIDCIEDFHAMAEMQGSLHAFRHWLETEAGVPQVSAMRMAKMFFP